MNRQTNAAGHVAVSMTGCVLFFESYCLQTAGRRHLPSRFLALRRRHASRKPNRASDGPPPVWFARGGITRLHTPT